MNKLFLEGVIWKNRFFLIKRLKAFYSSIEVKKNGIRFVDLYHALNEEYGLYEAEKSVLSILDKSIVLTEYEKKRALQEGRACMTSGDVEYNPEDLRCPNCGCKYIVLYEYFCYGRKNSDRAPGKCQRLSAVSVRFGEEYNYCLGVWK